MLKQTIFTMGLVAMVAPAMAAEWLTDFDAAKAQAAEQGKAVLVNFTGSDWCGYCMRMKRYVLDKPEFDAYAADKFVLLEVDIPRRGLSKEEYEKRAGLCRQYDVSGFPTFAVLNPTGELLGGFSGERPDVASLASVLDISLKRGRLLAEARQLQGTDRARAIYEIYQHFPKNFRQAAQALQQEIERYDPQDTLGLRERVAADKQMAELMTEVRAYHRHFQKQTEIFERYLANAHPLNRERIMERKRDVVIFPCVNAMIYHAETVEDVLKARDYVLREAEISYPETIKARMIEELKATFADPEAMLRQVEEHRAKRRAKYNKFKRLDLDPRR